jgi:predicted TIM-barrel fold metal-dependent hydrolase
MVIDDRLDSIRLAGLSDQTLEKILHQNAASLLHLQNEIRPG